MFGRCAAACVLLAAIGGCRWFKAEPVNLVLITVDTLRADHLGLYGYPRDTSPHLDAMARAGTWFERCYAQSVTTRASHASLFTGCFPRTTGVLSNIEQFPDRPSLMTALRGRGYVTAGFVSSVVLNQKFGLQRHFDHFDDATTTTELNRPTMAERPARETLQAALRYLEQRDETRPFFVWIHLIDPHGPYAAPSEPDRFVGDAYAKPGRSVLPLGRGNAGFGDIPKYQILKGISDPDYYVARYDAEIRYADDAIGDFVASLRALGLYDRTLMVVTADHGETLDEPTHRRYFSHGLITYEEVSRIPLIVLEPAGEKRLAGLDTKAPVRSIDIAPTILDLMGVEIPAAFEGRSMLRASRAAEESVYSLGSYGAPHIERQMGTQFSVRRGPWRYILNSLDGTEEIYDHRDDADESKNLAPANPEELAELRRILADFMAKPGTRNPESAVSEEERDKLRSLGYVR